MLSFTPKPTQVQLTKTNLSLLFQSLQGVLEITCKVIDVLSESPYLALV